MTNQLIEKHDPFLDHRNCPVRIAVLSDIHANLPALEVVLKKTEELQADRIYCLGDIVGYGPFPNECTDLVRKRCSLVVKGNHDSGVTGETDISDFNQYGQEAIRWTTTKITQENLDYLRSLPLTLNEGDSTLVHASPVRPQEWTYVLSLQQALETFQAFSTRHCFIGHTHIPIVVGEDVSINAYKPGVRHLINVGSVGQPRDGNPESAFGIIDARTQSYSLYRVPYDVKKTATAMKSAGLPSFLGKRLFRGR